MADLDAAMLPPRPSAGPSYRDLCQNIAAVWHQAAAAHERARELQQRMESIQARTTALLQAIGNAQGARQSLAARREQPQHPEYAQVAARLQTMPVIEQAKGIIMAQSRCGQAEAIETLRRASQQSNVPVRELAAQIVAKVTG